MPPPGEVGSCCSDLGFLLLTRCPWLFLATLCPPLRPPERGRMSCLHGAEGPSHQASCSFACEEGSVLVGPELVRCTASGAWTAPAPVCKGELQAAGMFKAHCPYLHGACR